MRKIGDALRSVGEGSAYVSQEFVTLANAMRGVNTRLICLHCGRVFEGSVSLDKLGWHSVCPWCCCSFDVDVLIEDE